jgi:hypothetical protein
MFGFIVGAIAGGLAVWYWGDRIREIAESRTQGVRRGAADTLKSVEKTAEGVLDRTADTLRSVEKTAEGVLDRTKEQVSSVLQAGQSAINPPRPR